MSLKTIDFTVSKGNISPKTIQEAGNQGEHLITDVVFKIDAELLDDINALEGDTVFRVQVTDGAGGFHSSEFLFVNGSENTVTFPIEEEISKPGGVAVLHLVISKMIEGKTQEKFFSYPARLNFACTSDGPGSEEKYMQDINSALVKAKSVEEAADSAADSLQQIQETANDIKNVLQEGNTFIFDGGRPSGKIDIDLVVDSELDPLSKNPVENKVIAKDMAELKEQVDNNSDNTAAIKEITDTLAEGDYIVETGEKNGWIYEKRNSGIMKCYKSVNITATFTGTGNSWGSLYLATIDDIDGYKAELVFPFEFTAIPNCIVSETAKGFDLFLTTNSSGGLLSKTSAQAVALARPNAVASTVETTLHYQAVGFWK